MKRSIVLLLLALSLLASGCNALKDAWDSTKSAARTTSKFISPDPEIDTEAYSFDNPNQEKLANLFAPVDEPFSAMLRYVENQDTMPSPEWLQTLLTRFPWVDGVLVADKEGTILTRLPAVPVKRFSEPLVFEAYWRETFLKAVMDYPELGPELYLGTPIFRDVNFAGLIVASFDPRTLFQFCPRPQDLIIIQPGGGVWSPYAQVDEKALLAVDWTDMLKDKVNGQIKVGDKYYTWLARYIGSDAFIYATESADPSLPVDSGWWPF